ncbi:RagB/SusD family nutrient uptake outer membrane protein [uncultured Duncaniella sp.]|uniref:RagB/SusD family nutrient uptake outer membrane protein n=1 Tax=uncultured Duncaniella sp. TaxID=2768039 RepID=UPI0025E32576|nr:RagB/SusD family nutrient uptake outer membrane protein [uncultured Duncaniella sp.]
MKKSNLFICLLTGVLTLLSATSCEDWFDVDPRTEIKESDLFKDESGFFDALTGVYSIMGRSSLYGDELTMGSIDAITQIYYIGYNTAHPLYYMSTFEYENTRVRPAIDAMWSGMYEAVANVNNLLAHIAQADRNMFESNNYELIKGEALALRAYLHFDLLRLFGPSFRMDKDRKCIPYVTTVSKQNTPYSSPKEVVDLCLRDLQEAEKLLADDPVKNIIQDEENIYRMNRRTRMNLYATQALMARIYHYAGDKTNALRYAGTLIDNENLKLITSTMGVKNDRVISSELLFALFVDNLSDWADNHFRHSSYGYDYYQMQFYMDEFFDKNAGTGSDVRYDAQFDIDGSNMKLSKYLSKDADSYNAKFRVPMLRLSEMYYIAAESTDDIDYASDLLNSVRRARALEPITYADFNAVESYLTREYRREFYGEGQLFFRYKWLDSDNIADGYLIKNVSSRKEKVYMLPLPDQEKEFGGTADK